MKRGVFVGTFTEEDIANNIDRERLFAVQKETGLNYCNEEFVYKGGKIVGLKLWACSFEDCDEFM